MGNCCRRESSSMVWATGDDEDEWVQVYEQKKDYSSSSTPDPRPQQATEIKFVHFMDGGGADSSNLQVKIKVRKRQLKEMLLASEPLRMPDDDPEPVLDLTSELIISRFIVDAVVGEYNSGSRHGRPSWTPTLHSIPE